ncbi:MAG: ABC transporter ATP-binding protein [Proteobacteria bacterium]|nr:ABC transporter ATP-binding protein [Pseudomonadota bacterium]
MSLLEVVDYSLAFDGFEGTHQVLDAIDLAVDVGETVGLVGETGCGKSVLAKSLLKLNDIPPARILSGSIRFDGRDLLALDETALRAIRGGGIAMIFQDPMTFLNPVFSIGDQMAEVIRARDRADNRKRGARDVRAAAAALLAAVRLPDAAALLDRYPHELSGGMRQRVLIAMALAGHARLLVADEPTTALDVTIQSQVLALLADLVAAQGLTLLLISHDLGVIGALCRRIVVMYAGTIVEDAPAAQLFDRPLHPYTQGLLAAVPDIGRPERRLAGIPGSIPNLLAPPAGCRFHPRCPLAIERCRRERPALRRIAAGQRVACHLAEPV